MRDAAFGLLLLAFPIWFGLMLWLIGVAQRAYDRANERTPMGGPDAA